MSELSEMSKIELSIEAANEKIHLAKCLNKLMDNPEFQELIVDGYLKKDAVRLVKLKASPNITNNANASAYLEGQLNAIAYLNQHFINIETEAAMAQKALEDAEAERDALYSEEN